MFAQNKGTQKKRSRKKGKTLTMRTKITNHTIVTKKKKEKNVVPESTEVKLKEFHIITSHTTFHACTNGKNVMPDVAAIIIIRRVVVGGVCMLLLLL